MKGKMLMFAKISIQSFNYDLTDVFMFPNAETKKIYDKYKIIQCNLVQNLTGTNSMFLTFIFICEPTCDVSEQDSRNIIFEVTVQNEILERLDVSDDFWQQFGVPNKALKKQVGFYEIKNLNKPNIITIAINPKEYFEKHINKSIKKKYKGVKNGMPGMDLLCQNSSKRRI